MLRLALVEFLKINCVLNQLLIRFGTALKRNKILKVRNSTPHTNI